MRISSPTLSSRALPALVFALVACAFAVGASAQAPPPPPNGAPGHGHEEPAPTNLKVLPKNLTGEQVHEIMHKWQAALGVHCDTCHAVDPSKIGPNGRPQMNFADDSKHEKQTARIMFAMTENINKNYVGKIESSGVGVTCGTCHRGHLSPEPFTPPHDDHDHDHPGPPPPGGEKPPMPR